MASPDKVYYLENDKKRFWELTVSGDESTLRYGKVGCKGRRCSPKSHDSPARCRQWAIIQANAKRFEGYEEPSERNPQEPVLKRRLTSLHAERLGLSRRNTVRLENTQPPKLTKRQESLAQKQTTINEALPSSRNWRKPPKKQSTIRALGKQISMQQKLGTLHNQTKTLQTKRQQSLARKSSNVNSNKDWRKPHKKQTTIRNLGKQISLLQKKDVNDVHPKNNWRNAPKKQSTIRRLGRQISREQKTSATLAQLKRAKSAAKRHRPSPLVKRDTVMIE